MFTSFMRLSCAAIVALLLSTASAEDTYPARPIKLIVPYAGGGNIDMTTRVVEQSLGDVLGKGVVVEHRPGTGGLAASPKLCNAGTWRRSCIPAG